MNYRFFFFFFFWPLSSLWRNLAVWRASPGSRLTWPFTVLDSAFQSLLTLRRNNLGHVLNQAVNSEVRGYGWKGKHAFDFIHGERILSPCTETWQVDGQNGFSDTNFSCLSWRTILTTAAINYGANVNPAYLNSSLCCWKWVVST